MARRSAADAAITRADILAAGREHFATKGYANAAARDIAAAAGVTVGALFHHFGSKAGLFRAVFEELVGELNDAALAAFKLVNTQDPLDAIVGGMTAALGFAKKSDFIASSLSMARWSWVPMNGAPLIRAWVCKPSQAGFGC
ncbi:MAG: TetR/AcrR family transcriptional regulator [Sphingopyxis sp.]|nr:TetR/AcrR family transcriptional regulator [Sphingopyxis sp.]